MFRRFPVPVPSSACQSCRGAFHSSTPLMASWAMSMHFWGSFLYTPLGASSKIVKIRPPAVTTPPTLLGYSWLRHHVGSEIQRRRFGGPIVRSPDTALPLASCRKCDHSSIPAGRGLTVFVHVPPRWTYATPFGPRTRRISFIETPASSETTRFTRPST